jgi:hypothetical protein
MTDHAVAGRSTARLGRLPLVKQKISRLFKQNLLPNVLLMCAPRPRSILYPPIPQESCPFPHTPCASMAALRTTAKFAQKRQFLRPYLLIPPPLSANDGGTTSPTQEPATGTDQEEIQFFWVSDIGDRLVGVTTTLPTGETMTQLTHFTLSVPKFDPAPTQFGSVSLTADSSRFKLHGASDPTFGIGDVGIIYGAKVTVPDNEGNFAASDGRWKAVQLMVPMATVTYTDASIWHYLYQGQLGLDTVDPYGREHLTGSATLDNAIMGKEIDSPGVSLIDCPPGIEDPNGPKPQSFNFGFDFTTYIMFRPPGEHSRYVPVSFFTWKASGFGNKGTGGWAPNVTGRQTAPTPWQPATTEPQWTVVHDASTFVKQ